jgi:hypothetical protein
VDDERDNVVEFMSPTGAFLMFGCYCYPLSALDHNSPTIYETPARSEGCLQEAQEGYHASYTLENSPE